MSARVSQAEKELMWKLYQKYGTFKAVAEKLGDTGRVLVRESGTEPVVRVMVEAETEAICTTYCGEIVDVIRAKGHLEA